ncbi:MAG: flagellar hook-length control protein FliK [Nitrosomonadales bacterium]|nr:flagellar hook-length control protein FliK [Nitrosomonadales bacterium]
MLPTNLINALQSYSRTGKPLVAATPDTPETARKIEPGQQIQGTVQSKVSEGLFNVQAAGQTVQLRLPGNLQRGDAVKLQVVTTQPKITFSMVASTNPLSTPEQIGATARILANLAELPLERQVVQQVGNQAVWQSAQALTDTRQMAGALRETLGKSGLFYESHQAQWIRGERSTNQLLEEPQNLLIEKNTTASGGSPIQSDGMNKPAGDMTQSIPKELLHLVQQQLHTLEHHHLVWAGQVWPGQQMQWEIQGEPEQHGQPQDERQWSTEMELSLPRLGDIHARLVFTNKGLRLTLHASDTGTIAMFNGALPQLKNSLGNADIALLSAAVEKP